MPPSFGDLAIPLVNNWQARIVQTGAGSARGPVPTSAEPGALGRSRSNSWPPQGVTRFFEVGAGGVLTGLLRNINPGLEGFKFGEAEDWEKIHAATA